MPKEPEWESRSLIYPKDMYEPQELLTFIQLKEYTDSFIRLELTDEEQRALELGIMMNPTLSPVMEGTGGIREFQFSMPENTPGSLHLSAFYAYFPEAGQVALIELMETDEVGPMTPEERAELKRLFEAIQEHGPEAWES